MTRIDDILAIENPTAFMIALGDHVVNLDGWPTFSGLSEAEHTVACVDDLLREVNNGGFSLFYMNSAGERATETVGALERLGALATAALVREANAVFGPAGPPADHATRNRLVDQLGADAQIRWTALDERFFQYTDDFYALMRVYVTTHRLDIRS